MSAAAAEEQTGDRLGAFDWNRVTAELDAHGAAVLERLLDPAECAGLAALYDADERRDPGCHEQGRAHEREPVARLVHGARSLPG